MGNDHLINQWKIISGNDANIQDLQEITYQSLDVCHDQGQMAVAKKLLKSLTTTNKEVRTTSKFYQHETKTTLGFCLNPSKISADSRFNALYRSFMTFDEESFQKLPLAEKASLKGSVLQGLAEI